IRICFTRKISLQQTFLLLAAMMVVPVLVIGGLDVLINSTMGERLLSESSFSDPSARARLLAWRVFDYMTPDELIFGACPACTTEIQNKMNMHMRLFQIENPWLLMFMHLGLVVWPVWFAGIIALMWRLMRGAPLALKVAVVAYFIIASGNNSFGVKG